MQPLAVIIPWRDSGDQERRDNLAYVHEYYLGLEIGPVIVAGDGVSSGSFNRSAAYNRGMAQVEAETYLWNEADTLLPAEQIEEAVTLARSEPGNVLPFTERHELDPAQTRSVLRGRADPFMMQGGAAIFLDRSSIGQAGVTSRQTIDLIGGRWDEGFAGWGFDDNAMHHIFATLAGAPRWVGGKGIHLYHQPGFVSPTTVQAEATERNAQRFRNLCALSPQDLRKELA
jgi:hypothetical protein